MVVALVVPCTNMAVYGGVLARIADKSDDKLGGSDFDHRRRDGRRCRRPAQDLRVAVGAGAFPSSGDLKGGRDG